MKTKLVAGIVSVLTAYNVVASCWTAATYPTECPGTLSWQGQDCTLSVGYTNYNMVQATGEGQSGKEAWKDDDNGAGDCRYDCGATTHFAYPGAIVDQSSKDCKT
jgi:hypothetical protein